MPYRKYLGRVRQKERCTSLQTEHPLPQPRLGLHTNGPTKLSTKPSLTNDVRVSSVIELYVKTNCIAKARHKSTAGQKAEVDKRTFQLFNKRKHLRK